MLRPKPLHAASSAAEFVDDIQENRKSTGRPLVVRTHKEKKSVALRRDVETRGEVQILGIARQVGPGLWLFRNEGPAHNAVFHFHQPGGCAEKTSRVFGDHMGYCPPKSESCHLAR